MALGIMPVVDSWLGLLTRLVGAPGLGLVISQVVGPSLDRRIRSVKKGLWLGLVARLVEDPSWGLQVNPVEGPGLTLGTKPVEGSWLWL